MHREDRSVLDPGVEQIFADHLIWLWPPLRLKPSCQKQPFDCVFGSLFFYKKQREELQIDLFFFLRNCAIFGGQIFRIFRIRRFLLVRLNWNGVL